MKLSDVILVLIISVVLFIAGRVSHPPGDRIIETVTDTLVLRDTITITQPEYIYEKPIELVKLDTIVLRDTVSLRDTIYLSITQKYYRGKDYEAWVSGYKPNLDKIIVYPETKYISANTTIKSQPKRWGIGLQVGYGFGIKENRIELSPYIGVGISYNIFAF